MKCCVPLCGMRINNYALTVLENQERVTFHEFPITPWLRKAWLLAIGVQEYSLPQKAVVCSQHFQKGDFTVHRKLRKKSVPSVFRVPNSETSTIQFCLICLDSSASKLFLLTQNNNLARAYTNITGLEVSVICDQINAVPKLCPECAQRLTNYDTFIDKTMTSHSILLQLLQKDKIITSQSLSSVNRLENQLVSNLGKLTYEANHCDLYITEEDNNAQKEDIIYFPEDNIENLKSEDETMSNCENSEADYDFNYFIEEDDKHNNINKDLKLINNDSQNIMIKTSSQVRNNDKIYDDNDVIINPVTSNDKDANDKGDVFIICDSDDEMECQDNDIKHDISGGVKRDMSDDIDIDINDDFDDINDDIKDDIDDINDDFDIDEDHDNDVFANDSHNNDKPMDKTKVSNNSENRVSLNNLIFVKDTRPMIDNCINHDINELSNEKYSNDNLLNKLKIAHNSDNRVSLNNVIFVKDTRPIIQHQDFIPRKNYANQNLDTAYNATKIPRGSAPKISKKQGARFIRVKKPEKYVPRPRTQDCTEDGLELFTRTLLTYEEQISDVQKRKENIQYKRSAYKCEICFKGFWQLSTYNKHMNNHSDKYGKYECAVCGIHCKTRGSLYRHITGKHSTRYDCKLCKYTVNAKTMARMHARWHSGKTYKCPHCEAEFRNRTSYFSHLRLKHPSDNVCALCGFSFVSPAGVRFHISLRHRSEDVHNLQNLSGPSCEECNIRFASETAYQQHMAVSPKHAISGKLKRNQALPFRNSHYKAVRCRRGQRFDVLCELCGKIFPLPAKLREHMPVHTGEKKYKCEICPKRFTTKFVAKAHMLNSHSDNPTRLPCSVCHKEFRNLSNLYRHMRTHKDTRPLYKCDICGKTFTTAAGRNQHVAHVHHNVPWPKRNRRDRKPNTRSHCVDNSGSQNSNTAETSASR